MRSIRYFGNGTLKMVEAPEPEIKRADEVKIRVAYCGVCGSDLHFKRAELDFLFEGDGGTPIGHEATGVITELGPAATCKGLKVGDRVVYYYNEHCGSCYYCRNGQEQFCENMTGTSAAFSDYIVVREQSVHKLADTCSLKKGALIEPISVCLHGIDLIGIKPGQSVAISGGGTMGMIMTQLALHSGGTNITVIEPIAMKREMAKKLGAVHTIDPVNQDRKEEAMKITDGRGFDVVIEASGSWRACDGIEDPHNLGAIIRTANLAGAHGVILPKRRAAGLTATVVKASAGAIHYTPVAKVTNIVSTIEQLKEKGMWFVCADMDGELMYRQNLTGPIGLVIGNEGKGVSRLVKEHCDFISSIPMKGDIDSLNASVAAGVLAYEIVRQRMNH